jgi:hypothetical protein
MLEEMSMTILNGVVDRLKTEIDGSIDAFVIDGFSDYTEIRWGGIVEKNGKDISFSFSKVLSNRDRYASHGKDPVIYISDLMLNQYREWEKNRNE